MRRVITMLAVLGLLSGVLPARADVYKCTDAHGKTTYQNHPCSGMSGIELPFGAPEGQPSPPAFAPQLNTWEGMCQSAGQTAQAMTAARDRGATYTTLLASMRSVLAQPESAQFRTLFEPVYTSMLKEIFAHRWWTPTIAQQKMEFACIQALSQRQ